MNVKLLRKIQKHILAEPKRFVMGTTGAHGIPGERIGDATDCVRPCDFNNRNPYEVEQTFAPCGTAACIMGWARILGDNKGYEGQQWDRLCEAATWPKKFADRYAEAKTPLARAQIASARIDHFIKTKGAE